MLDLFSHADQRETRSQQSNWHCIVQHYLYVVLLALIVLYDFKIYADCSSTLSSGD